VDIYQITHEVI